MINFKVFTIPFPKRDYPGMYNESELIQACIRGERKAQKQLYDKSAGKLYAVALRYMKSQEEAGDVLQDAYIKIFNRLDSFRFDCPLEVWMRRIVINTALTAIGKRKINYNLEDFEYEGADENLGLESLGYAALLEWISTLPDGCKTVFNLYAIEGYKHAEIAEMLGISEGTSKSQFSRARSILMEKIEFENSKLEDR